jgi:hypothetical protein
MRGEAVRLLLLVGLAFGALCEVCNPNRCPSIIACV